MEYMLTVSNLQSSNAKSPISVTLEGMSTIVNNVHSLKADSPITVTLEGMSTLVNEVHPRKAAFPITVTLEGMSTLVNAVHPLHTPSGKDVTWFENAMSTTSLRAPYFLLALTLRSCVTPSVFVYLP